jgi:D-xylose transport system ATP-binding protein
VLNEIEMEKRASELLDTLSVRIPSVRMPVASLSGGQRQSVAIARSLLGQPKVVLLDEPTAALGVAQTAQVLDLIERLRDRGHGVVLISHNLADVKAVADRVTVLRLGRNAAISPCRTPPRADRAGDHRVHRTTWSPAVRHAVRPRSAPNGPQKTHKDWAASDTQERS